MDAAGTQDNSLGVQELGKKEKVLSEDVNSSKNRCGDSRHDDAGLDDVEYADDIVLKEGDRMVIEVFDETVEVICQRSEADGESSTNCRDDGKQECGDNSKSHKSSKPLAAQDNTAETLDGTASCIYEYQWPPDKSSDWFVLQEHVSEYLGIVSFKRKYSDIFRRFVDFKEKKFLQEENVVTEMQCDLGLTALRTEDVLDLMAKDYPEKYETTNEKSKTDYLLKRAVKSAAEYNRNLRRDSHKSYFDLQTFEIHRRREVRACQVVVDTRCAYPVALIPGQYQQFYKRYSTDELNYLPINSVLYTPHKRVRTVYADPSHASPQHSDDENFSSVKCLDIKENPLEDEMSLSEGIDNEASNNDSISGALFNIVRNESSQDSSVCDNSNNSKPVDNSRSQSPVRSSDKLSFSKKLFGGVDSGISSTSKPKSARKRASVAVCSICGTENEKSGDEELISCAQCKQCSHPGCLNLTKEMIPVIKAYRWQCMECKTCIKCKDSQDEEKMLFCDHCDRGYHTFCVGLSDLPDGRWDCPKCNVKQEPSENNEDSSTDLKPRRGRPVKKQKPEIRLTRAERMEQRRKLEQAQSSPSHAQSSPSHAQSSPSHAESGVTEGLTGQETECVAAPQAAAQAAAQATGQAAAQAAGQAAPQAAAQAAAQAAPQAAGQAAAQAAAQAAPQSAGQAAGSLVERDELEVACRDESSERVDDKMITESETCTSDVVTELKLAIAQVSASSSNETNDAVQPQQ